MSYTRGLELHFHCFGVSYWSFHLFTFQFIFCVVDVNFIWLEEGQDEFENDGFIVDDLEEDEEEDRVDSDEERRKKKKKGQCLELDSYF